MANDDDRDEGRTRYLAAMEERIAEDGYFLQAVGGRPIWSYTIGLSDNQPSELIIIGMSLPRAAVVIADLVAETRSGARPWPKHGDTLRGLLDEYDLRVVAVDAHRQENWDEWLLGADTRRQRHGGPGPPPALQLVWEDEAHAWNLAGTEEQPVLGPQWW